MALASRANVSVVVPERGKGSVRCFESSARLETQLGEEVQGFNETGAASAERTGSARNPKISDSRPMTNNTPCFLNIAGKPTEFIAEGRGS
jgi:hypothetical protein